MKFLYLGREKHSNLIKILLPAFATSNCWALQTYPQHINLPKLGTATLLKKILMLYTTCGVTQGDRTPLLTWNFVLPFFKEAERTFWLDVSLGVMSASECCTWWICWSVNRWIQYSINELTQQNITLPLVRVVHVFKVLILEWFLFSTAREKQLFRAAEAWQQVRYLNYYALALRGRWLYSQSSQGEPGESISLLSHTMPLVPSLGKSCSSPHVESLHNWSTAAQGDLSKYQIGTPWTRTSVKRNSWNEPWDKFEVSSPGLLPSGW